jgi:hypothetical protein
MTLFTKGHQQMKTIKLIRPYTGKLTLNERRTKFLEDTLNYHARMTSLFYNLSQAVCGAVSYQDIYEFIDKKETDKYEAIFLFQPVEQTTAHKSCIVQHQDLLKLYTQYTGKTPTPKVSHYLTSKLDEKYCWQDNRKLFNKMASEIGITNEQFSNYAHGILSNNLFIAREADQAAANLVSNLFGTGTKAPKAARLDILFKTNQTLPKITKPTKYHELQQAIVQATGENSIQAVLTKFGQKGATTKLQAVLKESPNTTLDDKTFTSIQKKLHKDEETYRNKIDIPHKQEVGSFIRDYSDRFCDFNYKPIIEAFKAALADIQSKCSNNLRVIESKDKLYNDFANVDPAVQPMINILQAHIHTLPEPYAPYTHSFGDLQSLFDDLNNGISAVDAIEECINNTDNFSRKPDENWLRVVAPHYHSNTADQTFKAVKYLFAKQQYEQRKPFPFVATNLPATWGKSNIPGSINRPHDQLNGTFNGQRPNMWLTALILDGRTWVNHHLCFASSRYFEEVYFYNHELPTKNETRNPKFGFKLISNLSPEAKEIVRNSGNRKKAAKAIERIKANSTHNVRWDDDTSFQLQKKDNKLVVTINHRIIANHLEGQIKKGDLYVACPNTLFDTFKVGDKILGQDVNQNAATANAVYEVAPQGPNTFPWHGKHLKLVETCQSTMPYKTKQAIINDALSYDGVDVRDPNGLKELKTLCETFITPFINEKLNKNKSRAFRCEKLYTFTKLYMRLIKNTMNENKSRLDLFRQHLQHILFEHHLSPLRLHGISMNGLDASRATKGAISSYFDLLGHKTDPQRHSADKALFVAGQNLINNQTRRRDQRVKVETSITMRLAHKHKVKAIVLEADLPSTTTGTSKSQNNTRLDWCAKKSAERKIQSANCAEIYACAINPCHTSHQNPFVHSTQNPNLRPRFAEVTKGRLADWQLKNIQSNLKSRKTTGTAVYYQTAAVLFCQHHGLTDKDVLKMKYPSELDAKIKEKDYLIPQKGGRVYISTYPVTSCAKPSRIDWFGKNQYECDADAVAAVNIILKVSAQMPKAKKS